MKLLDENIEIMMSFYKEIDVMKKRSVELYRDLKLDILKSSPKPNLKKIKMKNLFFRNNYWCSIEDFKENSIITGSVALKAFGFLDRPTSDLDLIIFDNFENDSVTKIDRKYYEDNYLKNYVGSYKIKKTLVDLFNYEGQDFIESEGYKFHNPYQILKIKLDLLNSDGSSKHFIDLKYYFETVNKMSIFPGQ